MAQGARREALVDRFENAVRAHEMAGARPPEERERIGEEYEAAKAALVSLVLSRAGSRRDG